MMLGRQSGRKLRSGCAGLVSLKLIWGFGFLASCGTLTYLWLSPLHRPSSAPKTPTRIFPVRGTIQKLEPEEKSVVISHEAIPSYMEAMTMPFKLRHSEDVRGLQVGDEISFQLSVTETESWIDHLVKLATGAPGPVALSGPLPGSTGPVQPRHPLLDYCFTNELGQAVSLGAFKGQALAVTFFFTRCPIPEFCPRLSKNFAQAALKLKSMPEAPANWHFLSVSFDSGFDTPTVLKAYAESYQYDPLHWSFLTGPKEKVGELARLSNVEFEPDSGLFNHNFRTMIIDASGQLQMVFPTGGDLSEAIVSEMIKAAVTEKNQPL
jgi:protein SCO1/2